MSNRRPLFIVLAALCLMVAVWSWLAVSSAQPQTLDQRTRSVASQLRCPVCTGESVADSPATLAQQMRQVIREQLHQGKTDQQVIEYFISRYGEQNVSWAPPKQGFTLLAWAVPLVLFIGGILLLLSVARDWVLSAAAQHADEQDKTTSEEWDILDPELEPYRERLQQELAADDPLLWRSKTEAN